MEKLWKPLQNNCILHLIPQKSSICISAEKTLPYSILKLRTFACPMQPDSVRNPAPQKRRMWSHTVFCRQPWRRKTILEKTKDILRKTDFILTYNGRHFDIPFVKTRAAKYGIDFSFPLYNLDLFQVLQGHSPLREYLPDLKQKTVEIFMGLADSLRRWNFGRRKCRPLRAVSKTVPSLWKKRFLLHNRDDLIQLCRLLPVIEKADFHKAMYKLGFPAGNYITEKIHFRGRNLCAMGIQTDSPLDYISFPTEESPCSLTMSSADLSFELSVPCSVQSGAMYFDARALLSEEFPLSKNFRL